ncbi:MAG: FAD binding domain-containing protein [Anaerolineaceae bacterium]|jgi:carbon-monoxide dehydrogenase medium subunit|nr:FAD binding domain-containing protein [Anaerolineaceae bacterium]
MWQNYIMADSLEEAAKILAESNGKARIIAGGTDLILEIERGVRPDLKTIIDISKIPGLDSISEDRDGYIHILPNVTHNHVVASPLIREKAFALLQACWEVGSPQIRNRGTVIGNLVTASPANDTISPLMALDAKVRLLSPGSERVVPLSEFYKGVRKTVMAPDEMIAEVFFKGLFHNQPSFFIKTALRKAQAISVINISVVLTMKDKLVESASITLGAVAPTIIHAEAAEAYLKDKLLDGAVVQEAARLVAEAAHPISDVRGSAEYRDYMVGVIAKRALTAVMDGVDKDLIPAQPILLMGDGVQVPSPKVPWNGQEIHTWINGVEYHFTTGFDKTLLDLIREDAGLTGTKEGCAEGECGACTVYLDGRAVMSCLVPAPRAHGSEIVTIEGLSPEDNLHPVQEAFIEYGAVQCGYCTPGFVMSSAKLLEERETPTQAEIRQAITGNLCRCTGYYKIIEAIENASRSQSKVERE